MRKKRRMLTMGLAVFMIVSVLCTNVVHATGIESSPTDLTAENYIEETVSGEVGNVEEPVDSDGENMEEPASVEEPENTDFFEEESVIEAEGILQENSEDAVTEEIITVDETLTEQTEEIMFDTESMWNTENFQIQHKIVNYWDEAYQGEIIISNLGETTIEDWNLMFEMDVEITQIWNASINSCENNRYIIANNDWNANINAGQSVSFGYIATYEQHIVFPECYGLTGAEEELTVEEYEITYEIVDLWEDGYVANLTITNLALTELRNWKISFDLNDTICDLWNGKIHNNEDGNYIIHCADYNTVIKPGESVTIGFRVQDNELEMYPENYAVKVIVHSTMRTDMRDDVIGIAYFEDLKAEDYRIESDGIQYVANQLNLVGKDGVTFEQIAQLGEEYEFEIVGYIELTNDYQVKFVVDKTYEELNMLIEELGQNELVLEANLNLVSELENEVEYDIPNDSEWSDEDLWSGQIQDINWGLRAINAIGAWQYEEYMTTVKVGLYDSMFDEEHTDLNFIKAWNNSTIDYRKWDNHGTHVAGTMAAEFDNSEGISGIAVKKELYGFAYKPSKDKINGKLKTTTMEYKYALALLIGNGVRVINVSLTTGRTECFAASRDNDNALKYIRSNAYVLDTFIQRLVDRGYDFVIVVAAGNENNDKYIKDDSEVYGYKKYEDGDPVDNIEEGNVNAAYSNFLASAYQSQNRIIVVGALERSGLAGFTYSNYSCMGDRIDIVAPGTKIYSTVGGSKYQNTYIDEKGLEHDWAGTSMAAPHVSGVASLAYSVNPELSGVQVKELIVEYHGDIIVKDMNQNEYACVNAERVVKEALNITGNTSIIGENTGFVLGRVCSAGTFKGLAGVDVCAYKYSTFDGNVGIGEVEDYQYIASTDHNGEFSLELDPGMYRITITNSLYKPLIIDNFEVYEKEIQYIKEVMYIDKAFNQTAKVKGEIINALDGQIENNVNIIVREGWNNYYGEVVKENIHSNNLGFYEMELQNGYYTIEASKDGYINAYANIVAYPGIEEQVIVICPKLREGEMRVVLTWGDSVADLDSHLKLDVKDFQQQHIFYGNRTYFDIYTNEYYELDVDDVSYYGPETMTFYINNPGIEKYQYYVYNYSGGSTGKELSFSGARVTIYHGDNEVRVFSVPVNESGRTWNVFSIINGNLVVENVITN